MSSWFENMPSAGRETPLQKAVMFLEAETDQLLTPIIGS